METFSWCRSGVKPDKQRCYAHLLKLCFNLNWTAFILTSREQGLWQTVGNGGEGSTTYLLSPSPSRRCRFVQNWRSCCFFMPMFEVILIQVVRLHQQPQNDMSSACCFPIKTEMRFPLLYPVSLVFSIFKSNLDIAIIPLKSWVIVPLAAV